MAKALAIKGVRILAVGPEIEVAAITGTPAQIVHLLGRCLVPGCVEPPAIRSFC